MILRHVVGLAIALFFTWMVFFGAGYFGAVWTHYFADEPAPQQTPGEVSVKIINTTPYVGPACEKGHPCPQQPKPHD